jgi:PAS domain S-box-containing protein
VSEGLTEIAFPRVAPIGQDVGVVGPDTRSADVLLGEQRAALPPDLSSPGAARRLLRIALVESGRSHWVENAELALSEVVTNAVLHAHSPISVTIRVHPGSVEVEVEDLNPTPPSVRDYDSQATTGRGMGLVAALTSECGVRPLAGGGKAVWFRIDDTGSSTDPHEPSVDELLAAWDISGDWEEPEHAGEGQPVVVLRDMPATLWLAARQHHDALLRELALYCATHRDLTVDLAAADTARTRVSNGVDAAVSRAQREGAARTPLPPGHPSPLPEVPDQLDLTLSVPAEEGKAYAALQDALDQAEDLAVRGLLLARPGLPEIVAVRDWACEQVIAQLAGAPPLAWPGTAQERFEIDTNDRAGPELPRWDASIVTGAARGVVAADDANRIVAISRPLADLLGWEPETLVGRRVVTIIPPRLREAHVAGFSAHLSTGQAHVLGVPLRLPALHADGTEIDCLYMVESVAAAAGRSVYLAWIEAWNGEA